MGMAKGARDELTRGFNDEAANSASDSDYFSAIPQGEVLRKIYADAANGAGSGHALARIELDNKGRSVQSEKKEDWARLQHFLTEQERRLREKMDSIIDALDQAIGNMQQRIALLQRRHEAWQTLHDRFAEDPHNNLLDKDSAGNYKPENVEEVAKVYEGDPDAIPKSIGLLTRLDSAKPEDRLDIIQGEMTENTKETHETESRLETLKKVQAAFDKEFKDFDGKIEDPDLLSFIDEINHGLAPDKKIDPQNCTMDDLMTIYEFVEKANNAYSKSNLGAHQAPHSSGSSQQTDLATEHKTFDSPTAG